MPWKSAILYAAAAVPVLGLALMLTVISYRRHRSKGTAPLALLALAVAVWSLGYALELLGGSLPTILLWAKVQYIGIVILPVSWVLLALEHNGYEWRRNRPLTALLVAPPVITLALVWTNEGHGLIWREVQLNTSGPFPVFHPTYGTWFWVHTAFSYLALIAGSALLLRPVLRSRHLYRRQAAALLISAAAPWVGNALYIFKLSPLGGLDITPLTFSFTTVVMAWALFRYQLLDIVPIARDAVIDNMTDGVVVLDYRGRIVDLNPAAQQIVGLRQAAAIGKPSALALSHLPDLAALLESDGALAQELTLGSGSVYDVRAVPLSDAKRTARGRLVVLRDITAERRVQEALQHAKEDAEAAARAKSAFLAHMSHELRTPLTAILGYSQLLQMRDMPAGDDSFAEEVEAISKAGAHLLELINNVLDLSKIEAGKAELTPRVFPVGPILSELALATRTLVARNANRLALDVAPDVGLMRADQGKLRQILLNLLGNAAKFTEGGTITLRAARGAGGWVLFEVEDTGIGIAEDRQRQLFQPFSQVHADDTRIYSGTGLGLAISRHLCDLMGGEITVTSESGRGSTFRIRLPAGVEAEAAPEEEAAASLAAT